MTDSINTGYFSFIEKSPGEYESIDFYGDQKPSDDEMQTLSNQLGSKIILMEGRIIHESQPTRTEEYK